MSVYQKIQKCKQQGKNLSEIQRALELSRNTVRKYYRMDEQAFLRYLQRLARRGHKFEKYHNEILTLFQQNAPESVTSSSIYDVLEERHGVLPATERSLRNFVRFLSESGELPIEVSQRIYQPVAPLPPGKQLQLDFGQVKIASGKTAYLFCAILSHSRTRYVAVQDHPFTTAETVGHLLDCFTYLGGRPQQLVIDQDRLLVVSENQGEIITTRLFGEFIAEQELDLYVCRKADPESKGKVENLVKFVKTSFFSARHFTEVAEIPQRLSLWLARRANGKLCQATGRIPAQVLTSEERACLRPLRASVFQKDRLIERDLRKADGKGRISVGGSLYSVPAEYKGREVEIYTTEAKLFVFERASHQQIACHELSVLPGQVVVQKGHLTPRGGATEALETELTGRVDLPEWQSFLQANRSRFARYRREQAAALRHLLDEGPERADLQSALQLCLEHRTVSAANLKDALVYVHQVAHHDAPDVLSLLRPELLRRQRPADTPVATRKASYYSALLSILGAVA